MNNKIEDQEMKRKLDLFCATKLNRIIHKTDTSGYGLLIILFGIQDYFISQRNLKNAW